MDLKVKSTIHNRFDIWKENVETGVKEQVGYAENIVLNNMWAVFCNTSTKYPSYSLNHIHVGTGIGELSAARTSLFSSAFRKSSSIVEYVKALPTSHIRRSIQVGLAEYNDLEFSEVGIGDSSRLCTHALIRDMNGNPTTILKTSLEIITIYSTLYLIMESGHPAIDIVNPQDNSIIDYVLNGGAISDGGSLGIQVNFGTSPIRDNPAYVYGNGAYGRYLGRVTGGSSTGSTSLKTKTLIATRLEPGACNGHIAEIYWRNICRCTLPAADIYAGLELTGVQVAIGDGVTDKFAMPSKNIKNDSISVKIDGVETQATVIAEDAFVEHSAYSRDSYSYGSYNIFSDANAFYTMSEYNNFKLSKMIGNQFKIILELPNKVITTTKGCATADLTTIVLPASNGTGPNVYNKSGDTYVYAGSPVGGVTYISGENGMSISPDGLHIAIVTSSSPYLVVYDNIEGVWTKATIDSNILPLASGVVKFNVNTGNLYFIERTGTPSIIEYGFISNTLTELSRLNLPSSTASYNIHDITRDGKYIIAGGLYSGTNPKIKLFEKQGDAWITGTASSVTYPDRIMSASFSKDGNYLAVACLVQPYLVIYKLKSGTWEKIQASNVSSELDNKISENPKQISFLENDVLLVLTSHIDYTTHTFHKVDNLTSIKFASPPSEGSIITADYTVNGIHKTSQRIIDLTLTIQFGEPV